MMDLWPLACYFADICPVICFSYKQQGLFPLRWLFHDCMKQCRTAVWNPIDLVCCRRDLLHLQGELLRERTRNGVLQEQLKPINIHRWRRLEVKDLLSVCVGWLKAWACSIGSSLPPSNMNRVAEVTPRLSPAGQWPRQIWTHPEDSGLTEETYCQVTRAWGTWTPTTGKQWTLRPQCANTSAHTHLSYTWKIPFWTSREKSKFIFISKW